MDNDTPFAFGDFTWLNGTPRNKDVVLDTKFFTPEVRFDTHYMEDYNQPIDHTIVGATESFRSGEVQIEQISVGGDFHWQNVRGRVLYMDGLFSTTTPRNDASSATGSAPGNTGGVGQWDLQGAYKYVSEAYGGYHFNVNHGLNVDAGIFVSYIGLFSYYNYDNWTYQPSYVSSNTPWFFNGVRIQWFPTNKLKIETDGLSTAGNPMPSTMAIRVWVDSFYGCRRTGLSSLQTSMVTDRITWVFRTQNVFTLTIASRSGIITIHRALRPFEGGSLSYRRCGSPIWRGTLRYLRAEPGQGIVRGLDALRPDVVPQGSVRHYARRRRDEQLGPLSDAAAAD